MFSVSLLHCYTTFNFQRQLFLLHKAVPEELQIRTLSPDCVTFATAIFPLTVGNNVFS